MRKSLKWSILLVFAAYIASCTVDAYDTTSTKIKVKDEDKPLSETYSVVPEDNHCLNVVYYIPADMDTIPLWHKRLSGITLKMQDFFKKNMQKYGYNKTFGLVVNDSNKTYIVVDYIKSKRVASQLQLANTEQMTDEILEYYKANPSSKRSNHFLVYMPAYTGSFIDFAFANPSGAAIADHGFAFAGCDAEKFNPKYFDSARGRKAYLGDVGQVMSELMHSFFQTDNNGSYQEAQFSLTGRIGAKHNPKGNAYLYNYCKYAESPDKINLTEADAMWLSQIQVFNPVEKHEYKPIQVIMEDVKFSYVDELEKNPIKVEFSFRTSDDIVGVLVYNDPWRSALPQNLLYGTYNEEYNENENTRTGGDGMAYAVSELEKVGDLYKGVCFVDMDDLHFDNKKGHLADASFPGDDPSTPEVESRYICKAEVRFRFIGNGGMSYPNPVISIKGKQEEKMRWFYTIRYATITENFNATYFFKSDIVELYAE